MKKLILLTITICLSTFGFSQTDFRKGFVVTSTGDTLKGLVDYREGAKAYKLCDFKASSNQNVVTYTPDQLKGYGFLNDKYFESTSILVSATARMERVFLEVLVRGTINLYKHEITFLIRKKGDTLHALNDDSRVVFEGQYKVVKKSNQYRGILNMLLFDCSDVAKKIQHTTLTERSMTRLVEDYNACKGETTVTYKTSKPWLKVNTAIAVGLNLSKVTFDSRDPSYYYLYGDFGYAKSPMVGISFNFVSPRITERISFHSDLFFLKIHYSNYNEIDFQPEIRKNNVTIDVTQLKIPIGLRYTFPEKIFTPYLTIGISSTLNLKSSSHLDQVSEVRGVVVDTYSGDAIAIARNQFGFWGGLGLTKSITKKINVFVEARYEQTDGIGDQAVTGRLLLLRL